MNRKLLTALVVTFLLVLVGCSKEETPAPAATTQTAQQPAAQPVDQATAATITGKVLFKDGAPKPARIRMDADAACAKMHSQPVYSQEVVVNDNGTLRWVFLYVKDGLGDRTFPTPKEPVTLDQDGCMYHPHVVGVMAGQDIKILNSDATTHNIHPIPKDNREWNTSMPPGAEPLNRSFARAEVMIPVKCNIHPWMHSYIGVRPNPYFAVTGEDGTFTIKGLPPGTYTIAAWQEKYGTQEQKVTIGPKETKTVDFTFAPGGSAGD